MDILEKLNRETKELQDEYFRLEKKKKIMNIKRFNQMCSIRNERLRKEITDFEEENIDRKDFV